MTQRVGRSLCKALQELIQLPLLVFHQRLLRQPFPDPPAKNSTVNLETGLGPAHVVEQGFQRLKQQHATFDDAEPNKK